MDTGKTMGLLTLQLPHIQSTNMIQQANQYISILEVSIPLLEGGLLYHGAFSGRDDTSVSDLFLFVDDSLIKSVDFEKASEPEQRPAAYTVRIGQRGDPSARYLTVLLHEYPEDPQQFSGLVNRGDSLVKFIYKDISDPVTTSVGIVVVVAIAVEAVLCGGNLIIGLIATEKCEKKKIRSRFGFPRGSLGIPFPSMDCEVTCL